MQETGKLAMGFAPICELHAAKYAAGLPAGWLLRDGGTVEHWVYPATAIPDQNQLRAMIDPLAVNGTNDYVKRADFNKTVEARAARLEALKANGVMLPKERLITDAVHRWQGSACPPGSRRQQYSCDVWSVSGYRGLADRCPVRYHGGDSNVKRRV